MFSVDPKTRQRVLLTPVELRAMLELDAPLVILAVQSVNPYTGALSCSGQWIPGAIDVEAHFDFAAPGSPEQGQRPLPCIVDLQAAARRWGLRHDQTIVLYDLKRAMTAARAWWVLKWAGLPDVRVLDGGLTAWVKAGLEVSKSSTKCAESDITLSSGHMPELDESTAFALTRDGVLLDARIRPNYIGGPEVDGDPKRGHIPGALNVPALDNFMDEGPFTNSATLAEMYRGFEVSEAAPVGVYCGAGMSAAVTVLALASIGVEAAMYPGSWSQWVYDPDNPVKRGPFP